MCIDDGSATELADRVEHVRHDVSARVADESRQLRSRPVARGSRAPRPRGRRSAGRGAVPARAERPLQRCSAGPGRARAPERAVAGLLGGAVPSPRLRLLRGAPLELLGQRVGGVLVPTESALRDAHSRALPRAVRDRRSPSPGASCTRRHSRARCLRPSRSERRSPAAQQHPSESTGRALARSQRRRLVSTRMPTPSRPAASSSASSTSSGRRIIGTQYVVCAGIDRSSISSDDRQSTH